MALTNFQELHDLFLLRYGAKPRLFFAPGRVNLIGEHTDYNQGYVLPFAIDRGTTVAAAPRADSLTRVHSLNRGESAEFDLDSKTDSSGSWVTYVEGIARSLLDLDVRIRGADLLISSDVPIGAGLSSSAALEVSVGLALVNVSDLRVDRQAIVRAAHRAETEYVGTQSGVMDPYVSVFASEGSCLLIDCRSLRSRPIPLTLENHAIVISDTGVRHALSSSGYNQRRRECGEGVVQLRKIFPYVESLRDMTLEDFQAVQNRLSPTIRKRCLHVITENARTIEAASALETGDFCALGRLMYESHESLRADYEVTSPELDALVNTAKRLSGVIGSRMTGGGFGGCTLTLVTRHEIEPFCEETRRAYFNVFGMDPTFLVATPGPGAHEKAL